MTLTLIGQRAEGRGQKMRRVLLVALWSLLFALCSVSVSVRGEVIDRVLAILPGQIITLTDVEAALELGLVEPPAGGDRIAGGLSAVIDRVLMLNEVRRVSPPEPSPAAIDARVARIRQRFSAPGELSRVLEARGLNQTVVRLYAADDLRLASYLDERFTAAAQPTDDEIRQAGEAARQRLTDERRRTLIGAWTAELRRRADVTVLP
jgi:hypothetical protein